MCSIPFLKLFSLFSNSNLAKLFPTRLLWPATEYHRQAVKHNDVLKGKISKLEEVAKINKHLEKCGKQGDFALDKCKSYHIIRKYHIYPYNKQYVILLYGRKQFLLTAYIQD